MIERRRMVWVKEGKRDRDAAMNTLCEQCLAETGDQTAVALCTSKTLKSTVAISLWSTQSVSGGTSACRWMDGTV